MISIVTFFWVDPARQRSYQITPEDVRIWDSMVSRNVSVPHRRICVTHRPDLINFMETAPLDMAKHVPGTCLVKLQAHKPDAGLGGRILLMDVDCVVVGSLDPIVEDDTPVRLWANPNYVEGGRRGFYQGSMQLFTAGVTSFLWSDFCPKRDPAWLNRRFGGAEQCWISERLNTAYPAPGWAWDVPHFTEADGVYGAGRLFGGKMGNGVTGALPKNARIVFTPGDRAPSQPEFMAQHPWAREFYHA